MNPISRVQLRWLPPEEGGRKTPLQVERYTPTARFAGDEELFSVVLEFPANSPANPTEGTLRMLFPDLVDIQARIRPGVSLEITEGPRVVAHCLVMSPEPARGLQAAS